jgi:hypothetical protein
VIDAFGQSEIEQLHEIRRHLDVCRLQIAMNDPLPVRHLQGVCDLYRDRDGIPDGERTFQQPLGERRSLDQLEYQGGHSVDPLEAIDGADVLVVESREYLGFALEADQTVRVLGEERREDLDRHVAIELAVARAVHVAHPATAKVVDDRIRAELPSDERRGLLCSHPRHRGPAQEFVGRGLPRQEGLDFFAQLAIAGTHLADECRALVRRARERGAQNRLDLIPAFAHHLGRSREPRRPGV